MDCITRLASYNMRTHYAASRGYRRGFIRLTGKCQGRAQRQTILTNQALLLGHSMGHALDRLPLAWVDGAPTSSVSHPWPTTRPVSRGETCLTSGSKNLGSSLCPTHAVPERIKLCTTQYLFSEWTAWTPLLMYGLHKVKTENLTQ